MVPPNMPKVSKYPGRKLSRTFAPAQQAKPSDSIVLHAQALQHLTANPRLDFEKPWWLTVNVIKKPRSAPTAVPK